jgi:ribosomal-protein-alanine N-acetyltransferase
MLNGWFDSDAVMTLVALVDEDPAGFAMVGGVAHAWYLPPISELLAISVEPSRQRLGIGRMLMKALEEEARCRGVATLILHTALDNLAGQRLFAKCGFNRYEIKRYFYPAGQHALMMYKNIL